MSDIPPISETSGAARAAPPGRAGPAGATGVAEPDDVVEISENARLLSSADPGREIRVDKVLAIREAILNKTYDVEGKIDATVSRLMEALRASA